jgi:hypothetical protein
VCRLQNWATRDSNLAEKRVLTGSCRGANGGQVWPILQA